MLAWRVYYANGSTFDSSMGEPDDTPALGGICILQRDADGRGVERLQEQDFYSHDGVRWVAHDLVGLFDRLASRIHGATIFGRAVRNDLYAELIQKAKRDPGFYSSFTGEEVRAFRKARK